MNGRQLKEWRLARGYRQNEFARELGVKSRTTLSAWENTEGEVPRLVELAVAALEQIPECRRIHGKAASRSDRSEFARRSR